MEIVQLNSEDHGMEWYKEIKTLITTKVYGKWPFLPSNAEYFLRAINPNQEKFGFIRIIAANDDGLPVGAAAYKIEDMWLGNVVEITDIGVVYQRKGVGSFLINQIEDITKGYGLKHIVLNTTLEKGTQAFYKAMGFKKLRGGEEQQLSKKL
jgi:GNAT superfamily N-acetyltransferase